MARKRRKHVINLERAPDGSWHEAGVIHAPFVTDPDLAKTSPFLPRSPAEIHTLQKLLGLKTPPEGVDVRPGLLSRLAVYEHPPVPGSIGRWRGSGTKRDPYRWVGVSEKLAAYGFAALVAVWGAEAIGIDVSNWWTGSALSVENDLKSLGQDFLNLMHIPYTIDKSGNVTSTGPRTPATFWTWLFQQAMIQGADLQAATNTISGLSVGFPSGQGGLSAGPPGVLSVVVQPPPVLLVGLPATFTAAIRGGTPPFTASWTVNEGPVQAGKGTTFWWTPVAGSYMILVTVRDANGFTASNYYAGVVAPLPQ